MSISYYLLILFYYWGIFYLLGIIQTSTMLPISRFPRAKIVVLFYFFLYMLLLRINLSNSIFFHIVIIIKH